MALITYEDTLPAQGDTKLVLLRKIGQRLGIPITEDDNEYWIYWKLLLDVDSTGVGGGNASFGVAASDEYLYLTADTDVLSFRMPYAMTLTGLKASVRTAPVGADIEVDVNLGGVSILSSVLTIDAGDTTSVGSASPVAISTTSLPDDGLITIDIDQTGIATRGDGLKLAFIGTFA